MKVVVTAQGKDLRAPVSPTFARCPFFVILDTTTNVVVPVVNKAMREPKGAGVQAVDIVLEHGVDVVVTNKIGPKAFRALQTAGVQMFSVTPKNVGEALDDFNEGKLLQIKVPTI